MSTLSVTQRRSKNGTNAQTARHAALARPASHRAHRAGQGLRAGAGHAACRAPSGRGQGGQVSAAEDPAAAHRAAQPRARSRKPASAQADRARRRLGHGQDLGPRTEGRRRALGLQAQGALRGRPDADSHAHAKAARAAHEEVDAVRALPHTHPAGEHLRAGEPLRRRHRGHDRADEGQRARAAARTCP